ncbi:restriction endonuclease subunit S [Agrobacterium sp. ES01]|uniref:restriction endonuclease subunit S n=1 Tax=Agrobacterium sp. ES01 TaxID=3420714 RepID=UPI003D13925C
MTFGDVLEIVERPIDLIDNVKYQLVTAKRSRGGVVARSRLMGREVLTKTQFQIARDDFLMSNRQIIHGGCGIVPPALDGAVVSNEYSVLRPKSRLLLEFLGYFSHSIYFQQTCFHASVGVDVEKMIFDCERWLDFKIHLPPLHEQRRIAEILSSVDEAIAATRAVIEQTRKVKRGVLESLLANGIGHTRFKQTAIGEIPEGWEVAALGELSEFVTSGSRGWAAYYSDNGDLFLRIANLTRSSIRMRLDEVQKVSLPQGSTEGARTRVGVGDILISITADLGIIGHVFEKFEHQAYVNQHIALVRPLAGQVSSAFLAYALSGPVSQRKFQHLNDAGAKAGLNLPTIRRFSVPLPPLDEQRRIVESLSSIDDSIDKEEKQLRAQIALKSSLMSDLLTGRKRVTDALPLAAE